MLKMPIDSAHAEGAGSTFLTGFPGSPPSVRCGVSRITPSDIQDAIANFDALAEAVKVTELARFLDT